MNGEKDVEIWKNNSSTFKKHPSKSKNLKIELLNTLKNSNFGNQDTPNWIKKELGV